MNLKLIEDVANAVLYEGYILYPYRATAVKNRQRFNLGGVYPPAHSQAQAGNDLCRTQTECLVVAHNPIATIGVRVRFLQIVSREIQKYAEDETASTGQMVESIEVDGRLYQAWQEAIEREVIVEAIELREIAVSPLRRDFFCDASLAVESLSSQGGVPVAAIRRRQEAIRGSVEITAQELEPSLYRVRITVANETPLTNLTSLSRDDVLLHSLASAHSILAVRDGEFISLLEPPELLAHFTRGCQNIGTWPVLVGESGQRDAMLSSPIILYDYPQIAPESAGNMFDGTEIDEILTLRIMSLTDDEKREMRSLDDRTREILERTEVLPQEHLLKLHGTIRKLEPQHEGTP